MTLQYKIVVSGPVGSGKTTAISTLSDIPIVQTDARPTDEVADLKNSTTVAMDYGTIHLGEGNKVHLYGTPGQERFDFMWQIMIQGSIGLILLINNDHPNPLGELEKFLEAFSEHIEQIPFCLGITHMDENQRTTLHQYQKLLRDRECRVPLFSIDARSKADMNLLVMAMLSMIDPEILVDNFKGLDLSTSAHLRYTTRTGD